MPPQSRKHQSAAPRPPVPAPPPVVTPPVVPIPAATPAPIEAPPVEPPADVPVPVEPPPFDLDDPQPGQSIRAYVPHSGYTSFAYGTRSFDIDPDTDLIVAVYG